MTAKAREASLTPSEQEDLDEYIQTADILAIVQSKARQALKSAWRGCSVTVLSHVQVHHVGAINGDLRPPTTSPPLTVRWLAPPSPPAHLRSRLRFAFLVPALSVLVPLLNQGQAEAQAVAPEVGRVAVAARRPAGAAGRRSSSRPGSPGSRPQGAGGIVHA